MITSKVSLKNRLIEKLFINVEKKKLCQYEINEIHFALLEDGLYYLQMRLPVSKITPEYIENVKHHIGSVDLNIEVYEATKKDLDSILKIHNKTWNDSNILFITANRETFELILDYPETVILIARLNGEDIGYIILDCDGPKRQFGIIAGISVLPEFQGKKIGLILCLEAWNYLKKNKFEEIRFEIYIENEKCLKFVKLLGFELFKIKRYPYNQIEV